MDIDYSLYLVTDRYFLKDISLKKAVEESILGGATFVQLREKDISSRQFYQYAKEVKEVTDYYKIPFVINDRIDIAQAVDADGVHLGQKDLPLEIARKILGKEKIIGISTGNVEQAIEAEKNGADYIGIGTVFFTGTKKDINVPIGLDRLREIASKVAIPKVAIGGINENNTKDVITSGVDGVAVISAILGKEDIREASRVLKGFF